MTPPAESWDDCPWDAGALRDRVAGACKSLIQARMRADPGYRPPDVWVPSFAAGELDQVGSRPVRRYLVQAERDLCRLQREGFLPPAWGSSVSYIPGPAAVVELADAAYDLLAGDPAESDPVAALATLLTQPGEEPAGWQPLVRWEALDGIRGLLDQLPHPPVRPREKPRWDDEERTLSYGGEARRVSVQGEELAVILRAFEDQDWADGIDSPLPPGTDLRHKMRSLNRGLTRLRFTATKDRICWAPVPAPPG